MLYFLHFLSDGGDIFNLFRYITFRAGGAFFTSLAFGFLFSKPIINLLKKKQKDGQPIREDGPETHKIKKAGTPTMGGVLIIGSLLFSTLIWCRYDILYVWIVIFVTLGFGLIGFIDDFSKLHNNNTRGISGKIRLFLGFLIAACATIWVISIQDPSLSKSLAVPIFKDVLLNLGWFYIPFSMIVIVGSANSVNLTDGLDGLATVPVILVAGCFAFISYVSGNIIFSEYLLIPYIEGVGEVAVFCGAIIGASIGFLWFNAPPAKIFMGDTGSLALGGSLGAVGVVTKHEIVLAITGGLFVLEAVSVIVQVISFKLTGKRIFMMAPIHHHFEKKGWPESTVVIRFWIISLILAMIGLATLKLR